MMDRALRANLEKNHRETQMEEVQPKESAE